MSWTRLRSSPAAPSACTSGVTASAVSGMKMASACRAAPIVLDQELQVRTVEFGERQFRGVLHRLRRKARVAGRRKRQDEPDLDLARADRGPGLRGGRRGRVVPETAARKSRATRGKR